MPSLICFQLRKTRSKKRLSVRALAKLADLAPSTISMIETGRHTPSYPTMVKLAQALEGFIPAGKVERLTKRIYHRGYRAGKAGKPISRKYQYQ